MRSVWREITLWVRALRLYAHSASLLPVAIGSAYAGWITGCFHWGRFWIALLAGALYHAGCNLTNDYFDTRYGLDRIDGFGGSKVLLTGEMTSRKMAMGIVILLSLGTLLGLWLVAQCGWPLFWLGAAGLFAAVFYTATPFSAKYNALGEPLVFLSMGVGMTLGGYLVQTGTVTWAAVWISLPGAFLVTAILQANDTRDLADDRAGGIRTLSILLGPGGARGFCDILLFAPYVALVPLVLTGLAPVPILLALLSLPLAIGIHRLLWRHRGEKEVELRDVPVAAAKLHLTFSALMLLGLMAAIRLQ